MATTFNPALTDDISKVRIEIGDAGDGAGAFPRGAEVQDATITYFLSTGLNPVAAAARVCYTLVAKYAAMVDVTVDHQMTKASQRYSQYLSLAKSLDQRAGLGIGATPPPGLDGPIVMGIGDNSGPRDIYGRPISGCWPGSSFYGGCI